MAVDSNFSRTLNLKGLLTETHLPGFEEWCIASWWDTDPECGVSLMDYLANALHKLRIGTRADVLTMDELRTLKERLSDLPLETKKTEVSKLACFTVLKWERSYDDESQGRFLDCLVEKGAPEDSFPGIDALAFALSPSSEDHDLLICGEVKGAAENSDAPASRPSERFASLRNQVNALVKRFREEIPQKRLFYDLHRLEAKVRSTTNSEESANRVRLMFRKYVNRHQGVKLLSFLVFRTDWLSDEGKRPHVMGYCGGLRRLAEGDAEDGLRPWPREQNIIMLFPIDHWGEEGSLDPIYEAL